MIKKHNLYWTCHEQSVIFKCEKAGLFITIKYTNVSVCSLSFKVLILLIESKYKLNSHANKRQEK